jgi:hypothetical protein
MMSVSCSPEISTCNFLKAKALNELLMKLLPLATPVTLTVRFAAAPTSTQIDVRRKSGTNISWKTDWRKHMNSTLSHVTANTRWVNTTKKLVRSTKISKKPSKVTLKKKVKKRTTEEASLI